MYSGSIEHGCAISLCYSGITMPPTGLRLFTKKPDSAAYTDKIVTFEAKYPLKIECFFHFNSQQDIEKT